MNPTKPWTREHTKRSIEELQRGAKPVADEQTLAFIKESYRTLYGFEWPEGMGLEEASKKLFSERMAYWDDRLRRRDDKQGAAGPTG